MAESCCQDDIDIGAMKAQERRVLAIVLAINAATCLMMVAAALSSRSSSLLSGALDNFGDALTYAVSWAVVAASAATKARVALLKGLLISAAAVAVAVQIGWRLLNPAMPIFETMGIVALLNLAANLVCLRLLTPWRAGDVNMASAWECSRNDVSEGLAVIAAAAAVWAFGSGWPDLVVAIALLLLFLWSAARVLRRAWRALYPAMAS